MSRQTAPRLPRARAWAGPGWAVVGLVGLAVVGVVWLVALAGETAWQWARRGRG